MTKSWEGIQPPVDINQMSLQLGCHNNLYGSYVPFPSPTGPGRHCVMSCVKVESHCNFFFFLAEYLHSEQILVKRLQTTLNDSRKRRLFDQSRNRGQGRSMACVSLSFERTITGERLMRNPQVQWYTITQLI